MQFFVKVVYFQNISCIDKDRIAKIQQRKWLQIISEDNKQICFQYFDAKKIQNEEIQEVYINQKYVKNELFKQEEIRNSRGQPVVISHSQICQNSENQENLIKIEMNKNFTISCFLQEQTISKILNSCNLESLQGTQIHDIITTKFQINNKEALSKNEQNLQQNFIVQDDNSCTFPSYIDLKFILNSYDQFVGYILLTQDTTNINLKNFSEKHMMKLKISFISADLEQAINIQSTLGQKIKNFVRMILHNQLKILEACFRRAPFIQIS